MKIFLSPKRNTALTLIEVIVVFVVAMLLIMVVFPIFDNGGNARNRALRIQCVNNLRQAGLAFRIWDGDHGGVYPMEVPGTNGGSMEYINGPNVFRHFQVMSNELTTPKILICPADSKLPWMIATNFNAFNNSNISYFVGVDAVESNASTILGGDRNITNGTAAKNGMLAVTSNTPSGWTAEIHNKVGNVLMADGSAPQVGTTGLRVIVSGTGFVTNRLQIP